jgi:leader peptidase (prepilin peptidase)/N-methyltransferase
MWPAERAVLAMALFCSFCFTLAIVFPVAVRFTDAKLAGLLGLYLGWLSWGSVLVAAVGASLIVAVRSTTLRTGGPATAGEAAVIPSVVTAAVLSLFVAVPLASCYTTLVHFA